MTRYNKANLKEVTTHEEESKTTTFLNVKENCYFNC